jgi:hypothetical protein
VQRYARSDKDIYLANTFLELSSVADIDEAGTKLVLLAIKFLRQCSYADIDVISILAHASAYFADVYALCGNAMSPDEVGNVLVTSMFLAHSYVQDETCPLSVWHRHLFKGYCTLREMDDAVLQVMAIRRYVLRLPDDDHRARIGALRNAFGPRCAITSPRKDWSPRKAMPEQVH